MKAIVVYLNRLFELHVVPDSRIVPEPGLSGNPIRHPQLLHLLLYTWQLLAVAAVDKTQS
jgi:hypothetical protein